MYRVGVSAGVCVLLLAWSVWLQWPDPYVHLVFCDVGQGDAILVSHGYRQLLVDGGRDERVVECLGQQLPLWDRTIEWVVATHADADHIGGLGGVWDHYVVEHVLIAPWRKETADFQRLEQALLEASEKTSVISPQRGQQLAVSPLVQVTVLSPDTERVLQAAEKGGKSAATETVLSDAEVAIAPYILGDTIDHNDLSIALKLQIGGVVVLLTGDLGKLEEIALIEEGLITEVDILKVAHHGSKSSTDPTFIRALRPEQAVISSGKNNSYGHPHPDVLSTLRQFSVRIWRTDTYGTIEFVSDGQRYWKR